ncbi:helix-turn-helix and ligand-binding sensor domain-containing protein [Kriegella aquimaris]|uniref:Regulatory protein, luxR family n=1 Tax=Kriegella aquimaris TaxID=192904 RepID=A0A1G9WY90_9FLAO|nr:triple tyrosine motif-containing protein [Kriegella aquimaris]SDM89388.1 regulatory protein, luxR family [Kriegella aquimaris]
MVCKILNLLFLFLSIGLLSQELPPVQNYSPIDYGAENQNWSVSQSDNKHIYVANNGGLLEFDGSKWKLYPSPNGTYIRSVEVIGARIYTGSYMEFGYWKKNEFGNLEYFSVSSKIQNRLVEDEHFWNISEFKDWVLFQSLDRIYIYNTIDESFEMLDAKTTKAEILKVGNSIYFQKINEGIFTIENGKSVLVSDNSILKKDIVVGAFSIDESTLLVTELGEFYFLDTHGLRRWNITADDELASVKVYSSIQLNDNSFVLGTIANGIYHIDKNGDLAAHINQERGLNNNTVLSLFQDVDHNLWLGLDNGMSVINLDSPFKEYIDQVGRIGVVYSSNLFNGFKYLGTNQGLFVKRENEEGVYKLVKHTEGQVWVLKNIGGTLFCGHNSGTFVVNEDVAEQISDLPGTWDIKQLESNNNLLLQGNYKGLSVLERTNGQWQFRNKIEGFESSSRFFEFVDRQHILVNHEYKGIFDLKVDTDFKKVLSVKQKNSKGTGSSLIKFNGEIVYTTVNGVFKFDMERQDFVSDVLLTAKLFNADEHIIGVLTPNDDTGKLWGFTDSNIIYLAPGQFNNKLVANRIPIPKSFRNSMGVFGFESITHLKDDLYLIGISNGYITLDLKKLKTQEYHISINSVSKEFYDAPKIAEKVVGNNEFNYSENNLNFGFSVPEFDKFTEVYYQHQLNGIYDEWSIWSTAAEVSFKNLPYGDYIFKVRAKAGNTFTDNIASFEFTIARPWYISNLAILLYVISITLITVLIHKLYKTYYKKQQDLLLKENKKRLKRKKLKTQKKIVQIKNEKLQSEIKSKNRELAVSTMSLIKKNEFLNAIKEQLKESKDNPKIKSVIRTIDRNINNADDWKLFEEAFNNADKDFLKKVKTLHPELTPNDLRLCAYLRLNLSSKEIAPLLNISSRSVEVKRYRLRKKMALSHENNLTDYIFNL